MAVHVYDTSTGSKAGFLRTSLRKNKKTKIKACGPFGVDFPTERELRIQFQPSTRRHPVSPALFVYFCVLLASLWRLWCGRYWVCLCIFCPVALLYTSVCCDHAGMVLSQRLRDIM